MGEKKLRLLLLDANVVLKLHELGIWETILDRCEVVLAETVVSESKFYTKGDHDVRITWDAQIAAKQVRVVSVPIDVLQRFRSRFKGPFLERLDAGEAESLAYLCEVDSSALIASADLIVWRVLGALGMRDQGLSLEEVLAKLGLGRKLDYQFTHAARDEWTSKGFAERILGGALS